REALAGALRVPEDAESLVPFRSDAEQVLDGGVHAQHLMVPGDGLDQTARPFDVGNKVLDEVEEPVVGASPPDQRLERDESTAALSVDHLPVAEELPPRVGRTELRLGAVRDDHEGVGPK